VRAPAVASTSPAAPDLGGTCTGFTASAGAARDAATVTEAPCAVGLAGVSVNAAMVGPMAGAGVPWLTVVVSPVGVAEAPRGTVVVEPVQVNAGEAAGLTAAAEIGVGTAGEGPATAGGAPMPDAAGDAIVSTAGTLSPVGLPTLGAACSGSTALHKVWIASG